MNVGTERWLKRDQQSVASNVLCVNSDTAPGKPLTGYPLSVGVSCGNTWMSSRESVVLYSILSLLPSVPVTSLYRLRLDSLNRSFAPGSIMPGPILTIMLISTSLGAHWLGLMPIRVSTTDLSVSLCAT